MDYEKYLIELFEKPLTIMRKYQLTEDELLKLDISVDGFDLEQLTKIIFDRYSKKSDTTFTYKDNILWVECPNENNEFKTEIINFLSNFPTYELKFINHGYKFE